MLAIKLSRRGIKSKPIYRILVTEKSRDPYGKYVENLGTYNPLTKDLTVDNERAKHWIEHGAQPTPTVYNLLVDQKVIEGDKVVASKSKPGKKKRAKLEAEASEKEASDKAATEAPKEEKKEDAPVEESKPEEKVEDKPAEEEKKEEEKSASLAEKE